MILRFTNVVETVKKLEGRKNRITINKTEKTRLERMYEKLDRFKNVLSHWQSRIERLLYRYQDDKKD